MVEILIEVVFLFNVLFCIIESDCYKYGEKEKEKDSELIVSIWI